MHNLQASPALRQRCPIGVADLEYVAAEEKPLSILHRHRGPAVDDFQAQPIDFYCNYDGNYMAGLSVIGMLDDIGRCFDGTQLHLVCSDSVQAKADAYTANRSRDQGHIAKVTVDAELQAVHTKLRRPGLRYLNGQQRYVISEGRNRSPGFDFRQQTAEERIERLCCPLLQVGEQPVFSKGFPLQVHAFGDAI
jgi:hypothetical protein